MSVTTLCYCEDNDRGILNDLRHGNIPDYALVERCCWKRICQVRSRYPRDPEDGLIWDADGEIWRELCTKRGYLMARQNPRGF